MHLRGLADFREADRKKKAAQLRGFLLFGGRSQRGASRIAPSRRITSPLSISFVTIACTSLA